MSHEDQAPAVASRRPRRRLTILIAGALAAGLLIAAGITYLAGGFADRGRFRAEPPACPTIEPSLHLLGFAYTTRQTEENSCHLVVPKDHWRSAPEPAADIIVGYAVIAPGGSEPPLPAEATPLQAIGDEAYLWNGGVLMRVSNLWVSIVVFPLHESSEQQVQAFAADVAARLSKESQASALSWRSGQSRKEHGFT